MGFVYEAEHLLLRRKAALKTLAPRARRRRRLPRALHPRVADGRLDRPPEHHPDLRRGRPRRHRLHRDALREGARPREADRARAARTTRTRRSRSSSRSRARSTPPTRARSIHRDVKPANVMIEDGSGRIYLMDFGIAKRAAARERGLTQAGRLRRHASTTRRRSRSRRRRSRPRADIYAFGGVLFECLTGKKPYERDTDVAVMFAHITEPPPTVTRSRPELPEALDAVIARAMAKAPEERYATCREMIEAARAALGGKPAAAAGAAPALLDGRAAGAAAVDVEPARVRDAARRPRRASSPRSSRCCAQPTARLVTLTGLGGTRQDAARARGRDERCADEFDEALLRRPRARRRTPSSSAPRSPTCSASREAPDRPLVGDAIARAPRRRADAARARQLRAGVLAASTLVARAARGRRRPEGARRRAARRCACAASASTRCRRSPCPAGRRGALADSAAVQLFVERAQEAKPSFELTDDNLEAVAEICRRLEGIPLAIELAAARVKLLTPRADRRPARREAPRRSSRAARDLPQRQQRSADAIEWSYNLLDEPEQGAVRAPRRLRRRLLARDGRGRRRRAARARVRRGARRRRRARRQRPRPPGRERRRRAAVRHARDDPRVRARAPRGARRARRRCARATSSATSQLAETAEPELTRAARRSGSSGSTRRTTTSAPRSPGRSSPARSSSALRLAGALVRFWSIRGLMTEGRRWLRRGARAPRDGVAPAVLGKAHFAAGFAALGQGDYPQAKPVFEQSLELAREAGDVQARGAGAAADRLARDDGGEYEEAHDERRASSPGGRSSSRARSATSSSQSGSLNILAELAAEEGDEATANELYEQSLALRRELGDKRLIANSLLTLGARRADARRLRARDRAASGGPRARAREIGDTWSMSLALTNLGRRRASRTAEPAEAAKLFARRAQAREGPRRQARRRRVPPGAGRRARVAGGGGRGGAAVRRRRRAARGDRRDANAGRTRAPRRPSASPALGAR